MREIALACRVRNKDIIDYLHTNIVSRVDFCETIITNYVDDNFSYLLFACDDQFVQPCETIIREIVVEYIESVYKVDYLKSKIKNPLNKSLAFNAYIKVLSLFDKSTDENALKHILSFNQTFFIDSFLEFRLLPLKNHWDNLAELSSDNLALFNSGTFLDVIKFLLNTMDILVYKVKIVCVGENYSIYIKKNKNARIKKLTDCDNPLDLITNVLNSCPNYIDIYLNEDRSYEAINFLSNVFTTRLKVYMKN